MYKTCLVVVSTLFVLVSSACGPGPIEPAPDAGSACETNPAAPGCGPAATTTLSVSIRNATNGPRFCHVNASTMDAAGRDVYVTVLYRTLAAGEVVLLPAIAAGPAPMLIRVEAGCWVGDGDTYDGRIYLDTGAATYTGDVKMAFIYDERDPAAPMVREQGIPPGVDL